MTSDDLSVTQSVFHWPVVGGWGGFKHYNMERHKSCMLPFSIGLWGTCFVHLQFPLRPSFPSPTGVNFYHFAALLAFHITAPVELTAAPVHHLHFLCLKAAAAAHQLTAVYSLWGSVAVAAHRAQHTGRARVVIAEVWTWVEVDQIFICVGLELGVPRHQDFGGAYLALLHFGGTVKLLFDDVPHLAEGWHGSPAGLYLTGAWHAVTFAFHTHVGQNGLQRQTFG